MQTAKNHPWRFLFFLNLHTINTVSSVSSFTSGTAAPHPSWGFIYRDSMQWAPLHWTQTRISMPAFHWRAQDMVHQMGVTRADWKRRINLARLDGWCSQESVAFFITSTFSCSSPKLLLRSSSPHLVLGLLCPRGRTLFLPLLSFIRLLSAHISSLARSHWIANIFCKHAERELWHIIHSLIKWLPATTGPYGSLWISPGTSPQLDIALPITLTFNTLSVEHFFLF